MPRKNIFIIIAIVVVVAIAGYIAYRGFIAGGGNGDVLKVSTGEVAPVKPILSEGSEMDFSSVKKYNSQGQIFNYPKPSPAELNLPLPDLIK